LETTAIHKYTNRLIDETSPYLLQHAHNPVDWFAWSDEAFEIAAKQDKPVFLSIGYSTCHWCHVMENESFTDIRIAEILNEHFISVKVDREQRPDVDDVYMSAVQAMTGTGGWPLSVFLTPDGKPFYGGTYFPPKNSFGRPAFEQVLLAVAESWEKNRRELMESAAKISEVLEKLDSRKDTEALTGDILKDTKSYLQNIFDDTCGGFGNAPKFPQPSNISFLLNYRYKTGDEQALGMVKTTLDAMAKGGIYDHLGGGFHRYSTDMHWFVPHFEKMLYDQALLIACFVQAYQVTGEQHFAVTAKETLDYILRDMTDSEGGFYSAQDADSEGKEGLFYLWEQGEIEKLLGIKKAEIFNEYYGVTAGGNYEDKKNILSIKKTIDELATKFEKDCKEIKETLAEGRSILLEHRYKRIRPHLDDKIITGWNGLMISSLAYAGAALGEEKYIIAAEKASQFILNNLRQNGRLMRYYRDGKATGLGFLDDYAFMILGLLDLYEVTFDARRLAEAEDLARQTIALFGDEDNRAFYLTGRDAEQLIIRTIPSYDGALPSGNSAAALALLKLGKLTMDEQFTNRADKLLGAFSGQLRQSPASLTFMLSAVDFWLGPVQEVVVAGNPDLNDTKKMLKLIQSKFLPNTVILLHNTGKAGGKIEKMIPFIKNLTMIDGKATAYVCRNFVCRRPVNDLGALEVLLSGLNNNRKNS
jgi:uncharacterized protein YyaL (SSP411 family)